VNADGAGGEVNVLDLQPPQLVAAKRQAAHQEDRHLVAQRRLGGHYPLDLGAGMRTPLGHGLALRRLDRQRGVAVHAPAGDSPGEEITHHREVPRSRVRRRVALVAVEELNQAFGADRLEVEQVEVGVVEREAGQHRLVGARVFSAAPPHRFWRM
jgi:hypothetical protein